MWLFGSNYQQMAGFFFCQTEEKLLISWHSSRLQGQGCVLAGGPGTSPICLWLFSVVVGEAGDVDVTTGPAETEAPTEPPSSKYMFSAVTGDGVTSSILYLYLCHQRCEPLHLVVSPCPSVRACVCVCVCVCVCGGLCPYTPGILCDTLQ